jgi:hypothetical protein
VILQNDLIRNHKKKRPLKAKDGYLKASLAGARMLARQDDTRDRKLLTHGADGVGVFICDRGF